MITPEEIFEAYYSCRKNKRWTLNALNFEVDYESKLLSLLSDINLWKYIPGRSVAFVVDKPVKREIFAADFRDRIVHHLLINRLNSLFEKEFIHDSYACRVGKGSHFGINRVDKFIRRCSLNYTVDCYILKLDISAFFMSINKSILYNRLSDFVTSKYSGDDVSLVLYLCRTIIFNDPTKNCMLKGGRNSWNELPADKSLFNASINCGLPIGNLTSQVFANFYMGIFDHFVKSSLGIKYYGRYVDDFIVIHNNKESLKFLIPLFRTFLSNKLCLKLHPKKIYLQHYSKGVKFLGAVIKPNRIYISNRTKGNFYNTISGYNKLVDLRKPYRSECKSFQSSVNSYLGLMKHYRSYNIRYNILYNYLSPMWCRTFILPLDLNKVVLKPVYKFR